MRLSVSILLFLFCVLSLDTASQQPPVPVVTSPGFPHRRSSEPVENSLKAFQASDFYKTIIDNNLFRPLGWTPTHQSFPYRLIGTLIPTDGNQTPPKAFLQTTTGQNTRTLILGEKVDANTTLIDIQPKVVIIETDGQHRTVSLAPHTFLTPKPTAVRRGR